MYELNDPEKAERMAADTFSRLLRARNMMANSGRFGRFRNPIPYSAIAGDVSKWARADTREKKQVFLNNIIITVNNWERQQNVPKQKKKTKVTVKVLEDE